MWEIMRRRLVRGNRGIRLGALGGLQCIGQESREGDGIGIRTDKHTMWKPWSVYFFAASLPTQ